MRIEHNISLSKENPNNYLFVISWFPLGLQYRARRHASFDRLCFMMFTPNVKEMVNSEIFVAWEIGIKYEIWMLHNMDILLNQSHLDIWFKATFVNILIQRNGIWGCHQCTYGVASSSSWYVPYVIPKRFKAFWKIFCILWKVTTLNRDKQANCTYLP